MTLLSTNTNFEIKNPLNRNDNISIEELTIKDISKIDALWRDLYFNSAEPNPCYAPSYVKQIFALKKSNRINRLGKILVIKQTSNSGDEKLIGLIPLGFNGRLIPNHAPIFMAQHSCFNGSSLPLVRKGFEKQTLSALLNWLTSKVSSNGLFMFKELQLDGPVGKTLINLLKEKQIPWKTYQTIERPLIDLTSADNFEDYLGFLKGRTKQTLKRKMRQLSSKGDISFTNHTGEQVSEAMEEFCELENKGWKGRAGTALLQDPKGKELALKTLCSPQFGQTRIECLRLDNRPIAMNIYIGLEKSSLLFKPTYDETYSKFSPGALLHFESIKHLYNERWTEKLDSAVLPTDQLSSIWRQKQTVSNIIFGFSPLTPKLSVSLANFIMNLKIKSKNLI